jgi:hypothetical protein
MVDTTVSTRHARAIARRAAEVAYDQLEAAIVREELRGSRNDHSA